LSTSFSVKIGENYKNLFNYDDLDACDALQNTKKLFKTNRMIKPFYEDCKKNFPGLMKLKCPITGRFFIVVPPPEKSYSILPSGIYRSYVRVVDDATNYEANGEVIFEKFY
jgi:hypothetical protein